MQRSIKVASFRTTKGWIVVPASVRRWLGINKGTKIKFTVNNGKLMIQPLNKPYFAALSGVLGTSGDLLQGLMEDKKREREL